MLPLMTRSIHRAAAVVAWALLVGTIACGRTSQPADSSDGAAGGWSVQFQPQAPPAAAGSFAPRIMHSAGGVLASWIERAGETTTLRFAERTATGWSPARTAASGDNWFASWADAPAVLKMRDGTLVASWYVNTRVEVEGYDLYLSRSRDEGRTWSPPFKPHRDRTQTQHGFASLFEMPGAGLGLVWLDGRDMENNTTDPEGGVMTLRFTCYDAAWKQGEDVAINSRVCECCQTSAAVTPNGVLTAFRDRTEREIRDIAVSRLERGYWTSPQIVHADNWEVDTCPVNGPALSASGQRIGIAWYTVKDDVGHAYAAFSDDGGNSWTSPARLDELQSLGYVDLDMLDDGSAVATWVEFADQRRRFRMRRVEASGAMSAPVDIAGVDDGRVAGYPRVARNGDELVAIWTESGSDGTDEGGQQIKGAVARIPRTTTP